MSNDIKNYSINMKMGNNRRLLLKKLGKALNDIQPEEIREITNVNNDGASHFRHKDSGVHLIRRNTTLQLFADDEEEWIRKTNIIEEKKREALEKKRQEEMKEEEKRKRKAKNELLKKIYMKKYALWSDFVWKRILPFKDGDLIKDAEQFRDGKTRYTHVSGVKLYKSGFSSDPDKLRLSEENYGCPVCPEFAFSTRLEKLDFLANLENHLK